MSAALMFCRKMSQKQFEVDFQAWRCHFGGKMGVLRNFYQMFYAAYRCKTSV